MTNLSISSLKRDATRHKKASGCTQAEALDQIARQHGYGNWSLLARHREDDRGGQSKTVRSIATSLDAIKAIMEQDAYLTAFGYGIFDQWRKTVEQYRADFQKNRAEMISDYGVEQFDRACSMAAFGWAH